MPKSESSKAKMVSNLATFVTLILTTLIVCMTINLLWVNLPQAQIRFSRLLTMKNYLPSSITEWTNQFPWSEWTLPVYSKRLCRKSSTKMNPQVSIIFNLLCQLHCIN